MKFKGDLFTLLGAAIGGTLGYWLFFWLTRQGFYGLIIPGGLLGFGAGFSRPSKLVAVVCGIAALVMGLFCEWRFAPFTKDNSLGYFLAHAHQLKPVTLIMIAVGGFIGFWIPFRRSQWATRSRHSA